MDRIIDILFIAVLRNDVGVLVDKVIK